MLKAIRRHPIAKPLAVFLALNILTSTLLPTSLSAITGGPSQPEFNAFTPLGTSDMVNLFTGDFQYSIPLMDVAGYPVSLNYTGGLKMNQQASWVGLGWDLNAGAINREMRGIPDEFNGTDLVKQEFNMKPNLTVGVSGGIGGELFGWDKISANVGAGVTYNNYTGLSMSQSVGIAFEASKTTQASNTASLGVNLSFDNQGVSVSPSLSFGKRNGDARNYETKMDVSVGTTWNARQGLSTIQVSGSNQEKMENTKDQYNANGFSANFDILNNTYIPPVEMPLDQYSMHINVKFGTEIFGADVTGNVAGFFALQKLRETSQSVPAFGYYYAENAANRSSGMQDFNLEKNRSFTHSQTNLCLPNFTYDQFSVTGHGVGGSFRTVRSDAGYVSDRYEYSTSLGGSLGLEIGAGNLVHGGLDATVSASDSHTGDWAADNDARANLASKTDQVGNLVSPAFFKMTGELGEDTDFSPGISSSLFSKTGDYSPIQVELEKAKGFNSKAKNSWKPKYANALGISAPLHRNARPPRNEVISFRKFSQLGSSLPSGVGNHHIGEYTLTKTDGARYVYGLPLFNLSQREVTFNASELIGIDCNNGSVIYNPGQDNSVNNKNGIDHYFNAQELPPFAHSWLLTEVLSTDYVDADNTPGPSTGDLGTWVRFDYQRLPDYQWRIPYEKNQAAFNEGLKTNHRDDKASYSYGKKQVDLLKTIQTKTHVAVFYTSARQDAYEVVDENGGRGSNTLEKLDSIHLFARPDWEAKGNAATPIKSVRFEYDYSLCPGIPSSSTGQGKLTLKKVYFTYSRSFMGALSAYRFEYGTGATNPSYSPMSFNVWGDYKPNTTGSCDPSLGLASFEYPFVGTNRALEDIYAAAWMLKTIHLPEGGKIDVEFEADDYATVQDKPAMQMFKIDRCGILTTQNNTPVFSGSDHLYNFPNIPNLFLSVELPSPLTSNDGEAEFRDKYVKNILGGDKLYFRFLTDLTTKDKYEYIEGYAKVVSAGMIDATHGYLKLEPGKLGDKGINGNVDIHPITKAAFSFGQAFNSRLMSGLVDPVGDMPGLPNDSQAEQILGEILQPTVINGLVEMFTGRNGALIAKQYGRKFIANKSWVRLYNPDGHRFGGGSRVKTITLYDNWDQMAGTGSQASKYVQSYSYLLEDEKTSSGNASYIPLGCKENPLVQPVFFTEQHLLAPDGQHYQERPFGESFFPNPNVGYRRVTVKTEVPPTVKRGAGKTVHEFYTSFDFPTRVDETPLSAAPQKSGLLSNIFKINVKHRMTFSQGYLVEINNMIGQKKSEKVYADGQDNLISGTDYIYETQTKTYSFPGLSNANFSVTSLKNEVPVITRDGAVANKNLGVDFDVVTWFTESETNNMTIGFQPNIASFLAGVFPGVVPTVWPTVVRSTNRFRAAVTAKVIHRQGILKKMIVYDHGASIATENLAWDETGDVLLTRTDNEFGDPLYTFKFPAHWIYEGMGPANKNIMLRKTLTIGTNGLIPSSNTTNLVPGDEVLREGANPKKYWVLRGSGTNLHLVDQAGNPAPSAPATTYQVTRSGLRNLQHTPAGSITTTFNPIDRNNDGKLDPLNFAQISAAETGILEAQATTFSQLWQAQCEIPCENTNPNVNPYVVGVRGNWRAKKAYLFLTPRNQTNYSANSDQHLNIREDGQFYKFSSFWRAPLLKGAYWTEYPAAPVGWQWSSEVTKWLPTAQEVENVDALGRYSAAQFGYNDAFAVAVATNSKYNQMGFDGFEDYPTTFSFCKPPHFGFEGFEQNRSNQVSHTGRYSMNVLPGNTVYMARSLSTAPCDATLNAVPFTLKSCDCVGRFGPETPSGKPIRYVLSFWRKQQNLGSGPIFDYPQLLTELKLLTTGMPIPVVETQVSKIIEGWQKVDLVFDLPSNATGKFYIGFKNASTAQCWIDDVRIHPFNGTLKSFVYDPLTYRLWAELDERNFATFFEYDREGILIRTKKETLQGVMTLNENNNSLKKQ